MFRSLAALQSRLARPDSPFDSAQGRLGWLSPNEFGDLLELFTKGGELLLDFGEFSAKAGDLFFQSGEAIGS